MNADELEKVEGGNVEGGMDSMEQSAVSRSDDTPSSVTDSRYEVGDQPAADDDKLVDMELCDIEPGPDMKRGNAELRRNDVESGRGDVEPSRDAERGNVEAVRDAEDVVKQKQDLENIVEQEPDTEHVERTENGREPDQLNSEHVAKHEEGAEQVVPHVEDHEERNGEHGQDDLNSCQHPHAEPVKAETLEISTEHSSHGQNEPAAAEQTSLAGVDQVLETAAEPVSQNNMEQAGQTVVEQTGLTGTAHTRETDAKETLEGPTANDLQTLEIIDAEKVAQIDSDSPTATSAAELLSETKVAEAISESTSAVQEQISGSSADDGEHQTSPEGQTGEELRELDVTTTSSMSSADKMIENDKTTSEMPTKLNAVDTPTVGEPRTAADDAFITGSAVVVDEGAESKKRAESTEEKQPEAEIQDAPGASDETNFSKVFSSTSSEVTHENVSASSETVPGIETTPAPSRSGTGIGTSSDDEVVQTSTDVDETDQSRRSTAEQSRTKYVQSPVLSGNETESPYVVISLI